MLDGLDSHTQGWAFQHIIDPTNHGYFQLAYVLTDAVEDGRGLGYAGGIADIRLSDDGEIKALTLSEPNRFIYMIGGKPKEKGHLSLPRSWGSMMRRDDAARRSLPDWWWRRQSRLAAPSTSPPRVSETCWC
ncbi:hypothetical protein [Sphingomonas yabuuchiae]|uniref:hypothetical protein n=1 Tax=Sphingomonas yabuuchiae TaxID=172044 RepID=UPI003621CDAB